MAIGRVEGQSDLPEGQLRYVNAHEVTRHYGGPEEGGWYYDAGTPLAAVPVKTAVEEAAALKTLKEIFAPMYEGRRGRYSVIGEEDLEITIDDHVARAWPTVTPHYE